MLVLDHVDQVADMLRSRFRHKQRVHARLPSAQEPMWYSSSDAATRVRRKCSDLHIIEAIYDFPAKT